MSNGIMERNLPVAESLGSGDKVRIVTSAGNSKNVDASLIGGGALKVTINDCQYDEHHLLIGGTLDKTYAEISRASSLLFVSSDETDYKIYQPVTMVAAGGMYGVIIRDPFDETESSDKDFESSTSDGVLTLQPGL